jgi:cytidylate kinase
MQQQLHALRMAPPDQLSPITPRILLTADESVRMERRGLEVPPQSRDELTRLVRDRDAADARVSDFMTAADGVVTIDSTNLTFDQTVDAVVAYIRSASA